MGRLSVLRPVNYDALFIFGSLSRDWLFDGFGVVSMS